MHLFAAIFLAITSLLLPLSLQAEELQLREKFNSAVRGDYLVTMQNKTYTILHIFSKAEDSLIMEELTLPAHKRPKNFSWREWFEGDREGHTSWVMYEISLADGRIQELYSFSQKGWLELEGANQFFSTILNLTFSPIPDKKRRKLGPPPPPGESDARSVWNPRLIVDGTAIKSASFYAWKTQWPNDGSELAGKNIEVYLPRENKEIPNYFPYWLQISNAVGSAKIRVVDAGRGLHSPSEPLPRRPPSFVDSGRYLNDSLELTLHSPSYYKAFKVWAIPANRLSGHPISLKSSSIKEDERFLIKIPMDKLEEKLDAGTSYRFLIVPKDYDEVWAETAHPLPWPPKLVEEK